MTSRPIRVTGLRDCGSTRLSIRLRLEMQSPRHSKLRRSIRTCQSLKLECCKRDAQQTNESPCSCGLEIAALIKKAKEGGCIRCLGRSWIALILVSVISFVAKH